MAMKRCHWDQCRRGPTADVYVAYSSGPFHHWELCQAHLPLALEMFERLGKEYERSVSVEISERKQLFGWFGSEVDDA